MSDSSRRGWSFSLLTLLVIMSVAAAFLSGWACRDHWNYPPGSEFPNASPGLSRERAKKSLQVYTEENDTLKQMLADLKASATVGDLDTLAAWERQVRRNEEAIARLKKSLSLEAYFGHPEEWAFQASLYLSTVIATFIAGTFVGRRRQKERQQS